MVAGADVIDTAVNAALERKHVTVFDKSHVRHANINT